MILKESYFTNFVEKRPQFNNYLVKNSEYRKELIFMQVFFLQIRFYILLFPNIFPWVCHEQSYEIVDFPFILCIHNRMKLKKHCNKQVVLNLTSY